MSRRFRGLMPEALRCVEAPDFVDGHLAVQRPALRNHMSWRTSAASRARRPGQAVELAYLTAFMRGAWYLRGSFITLGKAR